MFPNCVGVRPLHNSDGTEELWSSINDYTIIQDKEEKKMMGKLQKSVRETKEEDRINNLETLRKLAEITTRDFATVTDDIPSRYSDLKSNRKKATVNKIKAIKSVVDPLD